MVSCKPIVQGVERFTHNEIATGSSPVRLFVIIGFVSSMRDLFFKTTQARHPSAVLRFVYSFLRLRNQAVFFVRPRSRFSLFFRLQVLRKMFVWFYTDRFTRRSFFRRMVRARTGTFRTFLNFCTTLETYIPVILYRFRFTETMRESFYSIQAGRVFCNGVLVQNPTRVLSFGDVLELFNVDLFKVLAFKHLIRSLPTFRFLFTLKDSIVNTEIFYALFVKNYSFFSLAERYVPVSFALEHVVARLPYFSDQYREAAFFQFLISRVFLVLFRCNSLLRFYAFQQYTRRLDLKVHIVRKLYFAVSRCANLRWVGHLWWYAPVSWGLSKSLRFFDLSRRRDDICLPSTEKLFGGVTNLDRDNQNVPDYIQNALVSRYVYVNGRLVLR